MSLQIRQGTNLQRLAVVLLAGEPFFVTDAVAQGVAPMWIGDGTTYGGVPTMDIKMVHDLLDVQIGPNGSNWTGPALGNGDILQYDSGTAQWHNQHDLSLNGGLYVRNGAEFQNGVSFDNGFKSYVASSIKSVGNTSSVAVPLQLMATANQYTVDSHGNAVYTQPQVGMGVGQQFVLPSTIANPDTNITVAQIQSKYTDVTTGAHNVDYSVTLLSSGSLPSSPQLELDHSGNLTISGGLSMSGGLSISGGLTTGGDLAVNGGDLTTTSTTATLFNSNATTLNIGSAATTVNLGASTGTTTINNNLGVGGNLSITGDLTVNGTTTSVNSTSVNLEDPVIVLGGGANGAALTSDDSKDRGIGFQYYSGSAKSGYFGWDHANGLFKFLKNATITNNVATGDAADLTINHLNSNTGQFDNLQFGLTNGNDIATSSGELDIFPHSKITNIGSSSVGSQQLNVYGNSYVSGSLTTDGSISTNGDVYSYNGIDTTNTGSVSVFNTNATTVNIAGAATTINIGDNAGEAGGTTYINNNNIISGDLQVGKYSPKFTVNASTGNTEVVGTLKVDGGLLDSTLIKGAFLATQNSSYVVPAPVLNTISGNNGIDIVSSSGGTNGYTASATITQYSGDITAGTNSSASLYLRAGGGTNSSPTAVTSSNSLGVVSFTGYSGSNFASYVASQNQGGGTTALHPLQIRGYTTETFAEATTTINITGGSISGGTATLTYATQSFAPFAVGSTITVASQAGVAGLNGTQTVTACTTTQVQFATSATGSPTATGTVSILNVTNAGSGLQVRAFPAGKQMTTSNRISLLDHKAEAATYRADTFVVQQGTSSTTLLTMDSNKAAFAKPVSLPSFTASGLRAVTGAGGWTASVSDNQGRIAYWNTSSNAWKYINGDTSV
jgi:hypothetical protein